MKDIYGKIMGSVLTVIGTLSAILDGAPARAAGRREECAGPPGGQGVERGGPPGGQGMKRGGPPGGQGVERGGPPGGLRRGFCGPRAGAQEECFGPSAGRRVRAAMLAALVAACMAAAAVLGGCSPSRPKEISFFMENDHGSYNLVELSVPKGDGPYPVVLMAHGFAGTLHSGGASELGARLAEKGVLACRIDFDPYTEPEKTAGRTHTYPLSQMSDDAVKLLGIVVSDYGGDPDRISLYGRSYGGRLVMQMANESAGGYDYQKLALVAPAGDGIAFCRYLGGDDMYEKMRARAFDEDGRNADRDTTGRKNASPGGVSAAGADEDGPFVEKLGVHITRQWFEDVETYDPTENGWKFGDKPVLLFYNTLDHVVYPDTSIRCAEAYENHEIVEVTTDDGHGYEMGYKESELKDKIMDRLVAFMASE